MTRGTQGRWLAMLLACVSACGGDDDNGVHRTDLREFTMLIDHGAWEVVPDAEDPWVDHRPAELDCAADTGWYVEMETLEVDTMLCNYAELRQSTLAAIEAGAPLHVGLYHFDLDAPEPAQAHVAVMIHGQLIWEQFIDIPDSARIYDVVFDSPITAPAGSELVFHLHNHGQNQWALEDVSVMLD